MVGHKIFALATGIRFPVPALRKGVIMSSAKDLEVYKTWTKAGCPNRMLVSLDAIVDFANHMILRQTLIGDKGAIRRDRIVKLFGCELLRREDESWTWGDLEKHVDAGVEFYSTPPKEGK